MTLLIIGNPVQYKFAPALIMLDPHETVDSWTSTGLNLNPRQLIPALMRYSSERRPRFISYLVFEFCGYVFSIFKSTRLCCLNAMVVL